MATKGTRPTHDRADRFGGRLRQWESTLKNFRDLCCGHKLTVALAITLLTNIYYCDKTNAGALGPVAATKGEDQTCALPIEPNKRAKACSDIIARPSTSPRDRSIALFFRALAEFDSKNHDSAIEDLKAAIKANPGVWQADWILAIDAMKRRDSKSAYAYWGSVVKTQPDLSRVYERRALSADWAGMRLEALADYDKAIRLGGSGAKLAELYQARGDVYEGLHEFDKAISAYSESIRLGGLGYRGRARIEYFKGNFAAADGDLQREKGPYDGYYFIWLYLVEAHLGKDALEKLRRRAADLDLGKWPGPIVRAVLGEISPAQVMPPGEPVEWSALDRKKAAECELSFYLGEQALLRGNRTMAKRLFQTAVNSGIGEYIEYRASQHELTKLPR